MSTIETKKSEQLLWIQEAVYGYAQGRIDDRWSGYRLRNALRFSPGAYTRLGSIFGWIVGIADGGNVELANDLADDICGQLDSLRHFGGDENGVSNYFIWLGDDGCFGSFTVTFYRRVAPGDTSDGTIDREGTQYRYRAAFGGGLIYHGPGAGQTFSVSLGNPLWQLHT